MLVGCYVGFFFFQAEDGIRDLVRSRGLGDVYKRQHYYLKNLDEGDAMRDASEAALSGGPSCAIILLAVAGAILAFIVVNIAGMNIASILLLLVGIVLLSSAVVMTVLRRRVSQAQQTIEELEDTVDLERFTALEEEFESVSYTHLRAHETVLDLVCRLLLEKKKTKIPLTYKSGIQNKQASDKQLE